MSSPSRWPVVMTISGALLFGSCSVAFVVLGGVSAMTTVHSPTRWPQTANVLGLAAGTLLIALGGRSLRTRPAPPPEIRSALLPVVETLQSLKHEAYRATPSAGPHLDALLQLAWQRDNEAVVTESGAAS